MHKVYENNIYCFTIEGDQAMSVVNLFNVEDNPIELKFKLSLSEDKSIEEFELCKFIQMRSVNRKSLSRIPLSVTEKHKLQESVGNTFNILWFESFFEKKRIAKLLANTTDLRLRLKDAYHVHTNIIEWNAQYSQSKIPDQAIGLDSMTLKLMQWVLQSWERVQFMNNYLKGTLIPRIQLDVLPTFNCGAHFAIVSHKKMENTQDYLEAGKALQRFWLTATSLGVQLQPTLAPLLFHQYADNMLKV